MKKVFTVLLSLAMTLAMTAVAFAVETNPTASGSIVLTKGMVVTNPDLTSVDGPGVTFTYAIAPVAPATNNGGTTITDTQNPAHTGTVHQGPADGIAFAAGNNSISYPVGTALNASSAGADNQKTLSITADISKFNAPGIYRYQITETASGNTSLINNAGKTLYIDVYVENDTTGVKFAGVVMHDGATANGKPSTKITYDDTTPVEGENYLKTAAKFETVNVTLQKTVSGNMADKNHQFPFAGTVTDSGRYFYADKGAAPTAVEGKKIAGAAGGSAISTNLADTETYYISGLSHEAAVAYTETNNTSDTYQTSITGGTASAASAVAPNGTKAMVSTDVDNAGAVVFNNALESVSPTGVVLRFGAPLLVLAAAAALFCINRKSRNAEN